MKIDLDKIESDAKAVRDEGTWGPIIRAVRELNLCVEEVDHIANCSPDVVLELVRRLREAEDRIAESESWALDRDTLE